MRATKSPHKAGFLILITKREDYLAFLSAFLAGASSTST